MGFLRRQVVTAALTANAIRPVPGFRAGIPAFFAGWLTSELVPHLMALTAADTTAHLLGPGSRRGRRRSKRGLALAVANLAGQAYLADQARRVQKDAEDALVEGLGYDYIEQLDAKPTPAELATPWRSLANPFRMRNREVVVEKDIPYAPEHGKRGLLDIYRPAGGIDGRAPVLLQVHGGGWTIGNKDQQGIPLMHHLAAKGWVCVAINYRLAPRDPFPAQIIDVKRAIAWIREHIAEHGGDPDYIAITGGSAGGHLVALAAVTANDPAYQPGFEDADTSVAVAVPHYGVYDFAGSTGLRSAEQMRDRFLAPRVVRQRWSEAPEVFEAGTPLLRVGKDAPDFFVLHGAHDSLVSVEQARLFVARLREVSGATVVYAELPGAQHAFDVFPSIRSAHVVRAIDRYLHWHWNGWRREHG
ncbi:alpha/beta hydrolase fold domain-containing protein [Nocardioides sp. MAH-18]|uniref:Alpha/beta hydrolase fold domain-containing protein n=1 Tax=Nocardioides agri TaxID=2682843 RepID=A0A6L6XZ93_9ACTN|nr:MULTISPECIES: alpha/beta hydrolase [unclassified Nocardioides]MBA2952563.1 alpha/beta hydrolase [Nocardioides sp. CGMCC 1.13656]MVQ51726.1 alpha/beta hydrolase fold domain-containing protein [Nocardioides sp. MAH-18]